MIKHIITDCEIFLYFSLQKVTSQESMDVFVEKLQLLKTPVINLHKKVFGQTIVFYNNI